MRTLLLVAHGSRRAASNDEVRHLVERLTARTNGRFDHVGFGFLELCEPALATAIDAAVAKGARDITLVPYFLAAGTHVANDIPEVVEDRRQAHPGVRFRVTPHLGAAASLVDILLDLSNPRVEH